MDNIREAIELLKAVVKHPLPTYDHGHTDSRIIDAVALLESEPEPAELAEKVRTITETAIQERRSTGYMPEEDEWYEIKRLCDTVDRLSTEKFCSDCGSKMSLWCEKDVKERMDVKNKELQAENKPQANHIKLLQQCDDSSIEVRIKMDAELKAKNNEPAKLRILLEELRQIINISTGRNII